MADYTGFDDNTSYQPTSYQPSPYRYGWQGSSQGQQLGNQVRSAIKTYTGRDATDDDIYNQHLNWDRMPDQQFMGKIVTNIANSDEAKAYAHRQANPQTTPSAPPSPGGTAAPPAATGSPVSANGQIAPAPAQVTNAPAPAVRGQEPNQTRYVQGADLSSIKAPEAQHIATATPFADPQNALMSAILTNPQTMNPALVAQLKEQQKEQALLMEKQTQQGFDSSAAARGVLGGGTSDWLHARLAGDTNNNILSGNRDIDIKAAAANRADELAALAASEGIGRYQTGDTVSRVGFNSGQDQQNFTDRVNQVLQQFGINTGVAENAQQNYAGDTSNWLAKNNALMDWLRMQEQERQFNNTLGFNYNQLNQSGQNSLLQFLFNSGLFGG